MHEFKKKLLILLVLFSIGLIIVIENKKIYILPEKNLISNSLSSSRIYDNNYEINLEDSILNTKIFIVTNKNTNSINLLVYNKSILLNTYRLDNVYYIDKTNSLNNKNIMSNDPINNFVFDIYYADKFELKVSPYSKSILSYDIYQRISLYLLNVALLFIGIFLVYKFNILRKIDKHI